MKTKLTRMICMILTLAVLCTARVSAVTADEMTERLAGWLRENISVAESAKRIDPDLDWSVFALARNGYTDLNKSYKAYIDSAVRQNKDTLYLNDYARIALAAMAVGLDASGVGGVDLIRCMENYDYSQEAYTGSLAYAFIALNAAESTNTDTKEAIQKILFTAQRADGGFNAYIQADDAAYWTLDGETDSTGIVLQALASCRTEEATAKTIAAALDFIHRNQMSDGGFGAWGSGSAESTSMILAGLCAIGEDPDSPTYTVNGSTMVDALSAYVNADGGGRCYDGSSNLMTTYQMLMGLSAYERKTQGQIGLFDMHCLSPRCNSVEHLPFFEQHPFLGRIACAVYGWICRLIGKSYVCCRHTI